MECDMLWPQVPVWATKTTQSSSGHYRIRHVWHVHGDRPTQAEQLQELHHLGEER